MYGIKVQITSLILGLLCLAMTEYAYCSKAQIVEGEGDQLEIGLESDNYKGVLFNFSCEGIKNKGALLNVTMFFDGDIKLDEAINHLKERASHMGAGSTEEMTLWINQKCKKVNWKLSEISGGFYHVFSRSINDSITSISVLSDDLPRGIKSKTNITKNQLYKICKSYEEVTRGR